VGKVRLTKKTTESISHRCSAITLYYIVVEHIKYYKRHTYIHSYRMGHEKVVRVRSIACDRGRPAVGGGGCRQHDCWLRNCSITQCNNTNARENITRARANGRRASFSWHTLYKIWRYFKSWGHWCLSFYYASYCVNTAYVGYSSLNLASWTMCVTCVLGPASPSRSSTQDKVFILKLKLHETKQPYT
jgi:hypothetical protein